MKVVIKHQNKSDQDSKKIGLEYYDVAKPVKQYAG